MKKKKYIISIIIFLFTLFISILFVYIYVENAVWMLRVTKLEVVQEGEQILVSWLLQENHCLILLGYLSVCYFTLCFIDGICFSYFLQ